MERTGVVAGFLSQGRTSFTHELLCISESRRNIRPSVTSIRTTDSLCFHSVFLVRLEMHACWQRIEPFEPPRDELGLVPPLCGLQLRASAPPFVTFLMDLVPLPVLDAAPLAPES
ncbi:MAG: hypothetical protein RIT24_1494 [Planctomycetota bacterium]|jgi:hypothetical protein